LPISTAVSPTPQPDPAGGAEHEQRLARLQMAAMGQREMRGAVGNRKGGSPDEIHRIGDRHHRGGVEHDLLGIAAAVAQHRERPLPDPQAIDRAACLDNLAGGFEPRGERELRLHLIGAADHQAVGEVDARGADPEAYLVLLEVRALGLFEPQHIGSAPFPATDRLHFLLLAIRPSLAPTISQNDRERSVDRRPAPALNCCHR